MALDRFNENMDIIAGLGDDPKRDDGLSTPQFKSVFDKAGLLIQKFLNEKLIPQIENFLDEGTVLGKITEVLSGKLDKTGGTMEGPINMNGQSLSGLNAPTKDDEAATKGYVNELIRTAAPRNLLDNSDFTNPVNQRGFSGGKPSVDNGYFIDRWMTIQNTSNNISLIFVDNGLEVTVLSGEAGVCQRVLRPNSDVTFAVKVGGTVYALHAGFDTEAKLYINDDDYIAIVWYDDFLSVLVVSTSVITIEWAALYEGEYTAETLPVYQPKGYGAELTECQRYYIGYLGYIRGSKNDSGANIANAFFPVTMRIIPTITMSVAEGTVPRILNLGNQGFSTYDAEYGYTIRTYQASADL